MRCAYVQLSLLTYLPRERKKKIKYCLLLGRGQSEGCLRPDFYRQFSSAFVTTSYQILKKDVDIFLILQGVIGIKDYFYIKNIKTSGHIGPKLSHGADLLRLRFGYSLTQHRNGGYYDYNQSTGLLPVLYF